jgi:hypothetical protein
MPPPPDFMHRENTPDYNPRERSWELNDNGYGEKPNMPSNVSGASSPDRDVPHLMQGKK